MVVLIDTLTCNTSELLFATVSLTLGIKKIDIPVDTLVFHCGFTLYFSNNNDVEVEHHFICLLSLGYFLFRCACSNLLLIFLLVIQLF